MAVLSDGAYSDLDDQLAAADAEAAIAYPGDDGTRQPVHTAYVPADRFDSELVRGWGAQALATLDDLTDDEFAAVLEVGATVAAEVRPRVEAKLRTEPIEDLRIDFEDGYGAHPDADEDAVAVAAAGALADLLAAGTAPPFVGIRFKSLEPATRRRGIRTLDLFLGRLTSRAGLPPGFAVTLPKVTHVDQVRAFADVCARLEAGYGLAPGTLRFEVQIETPQAILAPDGSATVARITHAGAGRLTALHYGTYDYSAACGVAAQYQSLEHPVADHAKAIMQLAVAGTGVRLSDGSTNVVPIGDHDDVLAGLRLHARLVRRSLERAYYQGWDLHPAQLVTRFGATYAFYRLSAPSACDRLRAYLGRTETGTLDEPATAQALAAVLVRGLQCGALDPDDVQTRSGVDAAALDALYRRKVG